MNGETCDVLVIGTSTDEHIESVVRHLHSRCRVFRLNIDQFPRELSLDISLTPHGRPSIVATTANACVDLSSVRVVWFRRLGSLGVDPALSQPAHVSFARSEAEAVVAGLAHLLEDAEWVSPFDATRRASSKLYQLKVAADCGLLTPTTLVTNAPGSARAFITSSRSVLYKTVHSPSVTYQDRRTLILSHVVTPPTSRN